MKLHDETQFAAANVFGKGRPNEAFARYFIGHSYLNPLTAPGQSPVPLANVTFEPGCRNNWHIHHAKSGGGRALQHETARAAAQVMPASQPLFGVIRLLPAAGQAPG